MSKTASKKKGWEGASIFVRFVLLLLLATGLSGCPLDKYIERLKGGTYSP